MEQVELIDKILFFKRCECPDEKPEVRKIDEAIKKISCVNNT
jgi:hypothetical protein